MTPLIRSACLSNYKVVAEEAGLDPYAMLADAGIDKDCLSNPDIRIPLTAFRQLIDASAHTSGWQDFGLRLVETRQLSLVGPLALLVREQATGRMALQMLFRYLSLHIESTQLWIEEDATFSTIHINLVGNEPIPIHRSIEMTTGTIYRILRQLLAPDWSAHTVCFAHSRPTNLQVHRRLFACRIEFDAPFTGIVCRSAELDAPRHVDPLMENYAQQYLNSIISLPTSSTADKVRQLAVTQLTSGRCKLGQIAEIMGVDVRTIRRRLNAENTSFVTVLDNLRKELALRYLETEERPLSEIAQLLGFSSLSAFSRWFNGQFGSSVTAWRAAKAQAHKIAP